MTALCISRPIFYRNQFIQTDMEEPLKRINSHEFAKLAFLPKWFSTYSHDYLGCGTNCLASFRNKYKHIQIKWMVKNTAQRKRTKILIWKLGVHISSIKLWQRGQQVVVTLEDARVLNIWIQNPDWVITSQIRHICINYLISASIFSSGK